MASHDLDEGKMMGVELKDLGYTSLDRADTRKAGGGRPSQLARMLASGDMSINPATPDLTARERLGRWMVNEGSRRISLIVFVVAHAMIFGLGFANYQLKDNLSTARSTFGLSYAIARAAALVLHFDVALILLPVCRTLISLLRQTALNGIIQFDQNIAFHKLVAWSIVFFTVVHVVAHQANFGQLTAKNNIGLVGFLQANFATGPGWSGWVMLAALGAIVGTSIERARRKNFERFWYTHHLFALFFLFWAVHGAFCMIKTDFAPFCAGTGVFWEWWLAGGLVYVAERVLREVRGRHRTFITKVIQHPSRVVEIQIKKDKTRTRAGQYIFLCCPEVSLYQYHPFTLTSAPEEDHLSVHIRVVGDFTTRLAAALGCSFDTEPKADESELVSVNATDHGPTTNPALRRVLPRVFVDGPFGSASEDVFKYEIALLVGAGIGVTPFAAILKSIWYRMNYPNPARRTRLRKVYFFWVIRDFGSFEWFRSLLLAIEAQDWSNSIEIHAVRSILSLSDLSSHDPPPKPAC